MTLKGISKMEDGLFVAEIITPEKKLFYGKAYRVLIDDNKQGQTAILAQHAPLLLSFDDATVSVIKEDEKEISFMALSGSLNTKENKVTVLMEAGGIDYRKLKERI